MVDSSGATVRDQNIHNLWLKSAAEGGVVLVAALASVILTILMRAANLLARTVRTERSRSDRVWAAGLVGVLVAGLALSMTQPGGVLGSMHASVIWWASAGVAAAGENRLSGEGAQRFSEIQRASGTPPTATVRLPYPSEAAPIRQQSSA